MTDIILINANVITLNPKKPIAQLVAIRKNKIQAVTDNEALKYLKKKHTRIIDCRGKTLIPGFYDTHFHLQASAASLVSLDLSHLEKMQSVLDIQTRIRKFSKNLAPETWVRATGYNDFYLAGRRHPTRWDLDKAAPNHFVKLSHQTRHICVLNSLALSCAGISRYTPDPPGGLIDRDLKSGEPNGILFEMNNFLAKRIPPLDENELNRGVELINQKLLSLGITSIHDASSHNNLKQWHSLCEIKEKNQLLPRVLMMLGLQGFNDLNKYNFSCPLGQDQLRLGTVKIIIDETTGRLLPPQVELNECVLRIHRSGLQVAIHAIEETAVEAACSAIEYALTKLPKTDHRHRIEHCSVCPPALAKRIAKARIMVVTQPPFIFYNGDRYLETVSNHQIPNLYPIGTLFKNGVTVAGSSDSPIVPATPLVGIYSAISRKTEKNKTISSKNRVTPLTALQMYTNHAAKATFDESKKGSIAPGKLADLVVLNGDPVKLPPDEIKDLKVKMTIIDGKIAWDQIA